MASKDVLTHGENYVPTINDNDSSLFGAYETYSRDKIDQKVKTVGGYDWSGKKIVFEGESITMNGVEKYPEYVAEVTGCVPCKIGQAGHPIMELYPGQAWDIRRRLSNIPADTDAIIIMGDCLGLIESNFTPTTEATLESWGGRWNLAIETIKKAFPTVPLLLVSEYPMQNRDKHVHVADQFQKTARKYGARFVCLSEESPLSLVFPCPNWGLTATDQLHCNHEAMPLFADVIIRHLRAVPPFAWGGSDTLIMTTTELTVAVGATADIEYSITGDMSIQWTSDNMDVACVMGGTVYGMTAGTATITATTRNGNTATCTVTVTE